MARSKRVSGADRSGRYKGVDYGRSIGVGFKVFGVLLLLGALLCLWKVQPERVSNVRELRAMTNSLLVGVYDALMNLKEPVKDSTDAFERLYEIARCPQCDASGTIMNDDGEDVPCPTCKGVGISLQRGSSGLKFRQAFLKPAECPLCNGSGKINYAVCRECKGNGYVGGEKSVEDILRDLEGGVIRDAFGGKIKIEVEVYGKKTEYTIISAGLDKRFGTRDDLEYSGPTVVNE